jgi:succinoglycan biosynthesis transport protein ExoP
MAKSSELSDDASESVGRIVPVAGVALATKPAAPTTSPLRILRALRRRQTLALGVALVAVCVCGPAAWFLVPPAKYKAQARLQIAALPPKVLFKIESEGGEDYRRYQSTQLTLVKSKLVLNTALEDKAVIKYRTIAEKLDPVAWLQENLKVEFVSGSEVMEISLAGDDAVELAGLVNAVKNAYVEEVVNLDAKRRAERHAKLKKLKETYTELLDERRDRLKKNAENLGSDNRETLALKQQYALEHMAWLRKDLLSVQSRKLKLEVELKASPRHEPNEAPRPEVSDEDISHWIGAQPLIIQLEGKLAKDAAQLEAHQAMLKSSSRRGSGDPLLKRLADTVATTETALLKKRKALRPIAIQALQETTKSTQAAQGKEDQEDLALLTEMEQKLQAEIKAVADANQTLNLSTLDLQSLQEEVTQLKGTQRQVSTEVEALTVELEAPPRVRTIEDAVPPVGRDDKKRFAMIGLITVGSFFAGLFGVAFIELQARKVDTADEVPADLGLEIVGTLPIFRRNASVGGTTVRRNTTHDQYARNLLLESIDATRTMLVHSARTGSYRAVMVVSAVGGEGKTSLATHLATSLARSGLRTLLIDADLRCPSIHRLFDLPLTAGLSELLRGEVSSVDAIAATEVDDLKILTAGQCDRRTIRLLAQGCVGPLIERFKEEFDFIIVDSSPILPVADALLVAQQVDAVLFSIFSEVSRTVNVTAALQRIQSLRVPILGAVLTGSRGSLCGNQYYSDAYSKSVPAAADDLSESTS